MITLAGVALVGAGLWYLTSPGRSVSTALADLRAFVGPLELDAEQAAMKAQIEAGFSAAGFAWAAPAAVANAYGESRLDPLAIGDGGHSVGLFQLHDGGAGVGLSTAQRQDPAVNIARILATAGESPEFLASRGRTHAEVTREFARWVERCAACGWPLTTELPVREAHLRALYGDELADGVAA